MHKNHWLPGSTEIPLVRTVRDLVADRPRVPCWHLLFRVGVTETDRFDRRHADLPRPLGGLSAVYILIWIEQSLSLGRFNLSQADHLHVLCGLSAGALLPVQPLHRRLCTGSSDARADCPLLLGGLSALHEHSLQSL